MYRFDPAHSSKNVPIWRLLVQDRHVWECNSNEKEFDQQYGNVDVVARKITSAFHTLQVTSEWCRPPKEVSSVLALVDSAQDVLDAIDGKEPGEYRLVTCIEPNDIALELWRQGVIPGSGTLVLGTIESFTIKIGSVSARISRSVDDATRGDQPEVREQFTLTTQHAFDDSLRKLRSAYTPAAALSKYSPGVRYAFTNWGRGPLSGLMPGGLAWPADVASCAIDVGRAYTGHLASITHVPSFSKFDELRPWDASAGI